VSSSEIQLQGSDSDWVENDIRNTTATGAIIAPRIDRPKRVKGVQNLGSGRIMGKDIETRNTAQNSREPTTS